MIYQLNMNLVRLFYFAKGSKGFVKPCLWLFFATSTIRWASSPKRWANPREWWANPQEWWANPRERWAYPRKRWAKAIN